MSFKENGYWSFNFQLQEAAEKDLKIKQVIVLRKDLNCRKGKLIAQGSHASMMFLTNRLSEDFRKDENPRLLGGMFTDVEIQWIKGQFTKIVAYAESETDLLAIHAKALNRGLVSHKVIDSGLTEFHGEKTFTAVAIGPDYSFKIDPITKHLKLL